MGNTKYQVESGVIAVGKGTSWEGEKVGEVSENDAGDDGGHGQCEPMIPDRGLEREDSERRVK